jgi:hypothetical protein
VCEKVVIHGDFFGSEILVFKCKIHTIPILMHQMRILTAYISSVILRPKNWGIQNVLAVKTWEKPQTECQPKISWNKI